jgi:hypothetical protein
LDKTTKVQATKAKTDKWNYAKIISICIAKEITKCEEMTSIIWRKVLKLFI